MGDDKNCQSSPWRSWRLGESFLMRHSFKVIHDELYTVKVRISPEWARWVGEKIWHERKEWVGSGQAKYLI